MSKTVLWSFLAATSLPLVLITNFTYNNSPSMPIGLYRPTHEPFKRGALVLLREPLKKIAAIPGDTVEWTAAGVRVNGELLQDSAVPQGSPYLPYPYATLKLAPGQYLTMGDNPLSYDGRYTGPIPQSLLASTLQPVWTKGATQ